MPKSNWRRVKGGGFMRRMLSPSDLERRAQRLPWRNLSSGRRRLFLARKSPLELEVALSLLRAGRSEQVTSYPPAPGVAYSSRPQAGARCDHVREGSTRIGT